MGSHQQQYEMYHDGLSNSQNPGSLRHQAQHQTLHRANSRQFDPLGQMPAGLYTAEDHAAAFQTNRFGGGGPFPGYNGYDMSGAQTWNPNSFGGQGANSLGAMGATGRMKPSSRQRSALPATWLDQQTPLSPQPHNYLGMGGKLPVGRSSLRTETLITDPDEELIPTAIVIKNIPFAAKKEQLVQLMTDMNLPLPYAFNYHFDNGVFRGLAFANFTTPEETAAVIDHLNHFELQGRKLRVEYKKMLPLAERERIEREKRERRGQLEEQHRPMPSQLHNQASMSSMNSQIPGTSPSPVSVRTAKPGTSGHSHDEPLSVSANVLQDVDLNDPTTLGFFTQLMLFKEDKAKEALIFPPTLPPPERRTVHTIAHHLSLAHVSRGSGEHRQVHVFRAPSNMSPPIPQLPGSLFGNDAHRRVLNRAATTDFSEARLQDPQYGTLGRQPSGLLDIPGSPGGNGALSAASQNLRAAKSFADLRSYTPSPVPSSASFPAAIGSGLNRFEGFGGAVGGTPNLTPTATTGGMSDEAFLVNGLGGLGLGSSFGGMNGNGMSQPGRGDGRSMLPPYASDSQNAQQQSFGGPIGGHRSFATTNMNTTSYDDLSRERGQGSLPLRQPRGPANQAGQGFGSRNAGMPRPLGQHHGANGGPNGMDGLDGVEIIVE